MAKQNVTFNERHLEKFVIGICGAALLGVAYFYVIDTPNKVALESQLLTPKDFYRHMQDQADQLVTRMKNARAEDGASTTPGPNLQQQPRPYLAANLPVQFSTFLAPPSPILPNIPDLVEKSRIKLAAILPP